MSRIFSQLPICVAPVHRISLAVCVALALCASCAVRPEIVPAPLPPDLAVEIRRAAVAAETGDPRAQTLVANLLLRHPESVDGYRLLQNLRFARGESHQVYEDALADWESSPFDPASIYLMARTIPEREAQRRWFLDCIDLEPSFYFGYYGLAVATLELGEPGDSIDACRNALRVRPGNADARLVLAGALERAGRPEEAREIFKSLLETETDRPRFARAAAEHLFRGGEAEAALDAALDGLDRTPGSPVLLLALRRMLPDAGLEPETLSRLERAALRARSGSADALLARVRSLQGRHGEALDGFSRASSRGALRARFAGRMVDSAVRAGRYREAGRIWREGLPLAYLSRESNRMWPAVLRLLTALEAAESEGAEGLAELARALSGSGFDVLAHEVAIRAASHSPENASVADLVRDLDAWRLFLADVRQVLKGGYEEHRREEDGVGRGGVLSRLSQASVRRLGRDVVGAIPDTTFPFVGAVMRSDRVGAPDDWEDHGTLLILGQRNAGPVEATLLRMVGGYRELTVAGVAYDLAVCEGQSLRSYEEQLSARIAGFTLPGWVLLNLDVVNRWEERVVRMAGQARPTDLWAAPDEMRRRSLWFPGGVASRLAKKHVEELARAFEPLSLLSSLAHECGHVVDLDGYFPLAVRFPLALVEFARLGFSTTGVEVELERTAETWSLLHAPSPRNALLNTIGYLPHDSDRPPHSAAYHSICRDLVEELDLNPGRYPSVDRSVNLVQQLDRLTDPELRELIDRALKSGGFSRGRGRGLRGPLPV